MEREKKENIWRRKTLFRRKKRREIFGEGRYDSFSDVGESRVWFASKNLTPCGMH